MHVEFGSVRLRPRAWDGPLLVFCFIFMTPPGLGIPPVRPTVKVTIRVNESRLTCCHAGAMTKEVRVTGSLCKEGRECQVLDPFMQFIHARIHLAFSDECIIVNYGGLRRFGCIFRYACA